jgi:hypothetical protein
MQRLKFWGIRVIYISQGIDSDSEQAEPLVAVHGLIDSLYLKELAKKIRRGLAGQQERGFATGGRTFGYRTIAVPDPSGKKDPNGGPVLLGKRIEIDAAAASSIRQIFEWAADGVGPVPSRSALMPTTGQSRPAAAGERGRSSGCCKTSATAVCTFGGRDIGSGNRARDERPSADVREASGVSWSGRTYGLSRRSCGRECRQHGLQSARQSRQSAISLAARTLGSTRHLFSGFARCASCGGRIGSVSGGKGKSPIRLH